ncbi:MAG: 23S rRNA (adenine(2503)-C(2))-methyltransferase RlmN [bacterium]|nr:23S rRNA (adenine(2503)-C(2))-methyltransferase RlmN [bacterium]
MKNIYGMKRADLEEYFTTINEKKFKALQVFEWLYLKRINDFSLMTNIKKEIQEKLKQDFTMDMITLDSSQDDNLTHKYLFKLADNNYIEAVLMEHDYGLSVCVSSEVGCNMGCKFCESGRRKKVRNLETYEMVEQILLIEAKIQKRISSVVVMGIGEPFDNYDNLMDFIRIINDSKGLAIGARHITVSTCGLVPKIYDFANEDLQVNLALSLHGPDDDIRNRLMPINKVYSISKVMKAISDYIEKTNRRVTIEYVMLNNVNDSVDAASKLAKLLKGLNVYVNLIPYNETNHIEFSKSSKENIDKFYNTLQANKINVTVRREFGGKIDAACGQLRSKKEES